MTLTTATSGATIRYTLDGSDPGDGVGLLYSAPIAGLDNVTIRATAYTATLLNAPITQAIIT